MKPTEAKARSSLDRMTNGSVDEEVDRPSGKVKVRVNGHMGDEGDGEDGEGDGKREEDGEDGEGGGGGREEEEESDESPETLRHLLSQTRLEKETLEKQYSHLLAKLTQMRTSLGNKLRQDAEELDRREASLLLLQSEKEDLLGTVQTLQEELGQVNEEVVRLEGEMGEMRRGMGRLERELVEMGGSMHHSETGLVEMREEVERERRAKEEWKQEAMQHKSALEQLSDQLDSARRDTLQLKDVQGKLEEEKEKVHNLEAVLADFSNAKEREMKEVERRLDDTLQGLAEWKAKALSAQVELEESRMGMGHVADLEKQLKEKHLLIGKLRHEAVIINEHLTEALRRLRRSSSESNVDKRLVSNVILSFLSTSRGDSKRWEMLNLLSSILGWGDAEREKAGLQKRGGDPSSAGGGGGFWGKSPLPKTPIELEKSDETESFSRLWVEFLLTEANSASSPTDTHHSNSLMSPAMHSAPPSLVQRTASSGSLPLSGGGGGGYGFGLGAVVPRRLASLSSSGASTPDLLGNGNGKGKERA